MAIRSLSTDIEYRVRAWYTGRDSLNRQTAFGAPEGTRFIFAFGKNHCVDAVEPASSNRPPDDRIEFFESLARRAK